MVSSFAKTATYIKDNYTAGQPGIQRQIARLKELINRIDGGWQRGANRSWSTHTFCFPSAPLYHHLQAQGIEFIQFAFRWMNCLLMRELSLRNTIRMWDSYQAEGTDGFSEFHLYVCAAFLVKWSNELKKMEFQVSGCKEAISRSHIHWVFFRI